MVSKLIFEISTFKWRGTTALDPDRIDRRGYHVYTQDKVLPYRSHALNTSAIWVRSVCAICVCELLGVSHFGHDFHTYRTV